PDWTERRRDSALQSHYDKTGQWWHSPTAPGWLEPATQSRQKPPLRTDPAHHARGRAGGLRLLAALSANWTVEECPRYAKPHPRKSKRHRTHPAIPGCHQ